MWRVNYLIVLCAWTGSTLGAERLFDFSTFPPNQPPAGFESAISGTGKPGDWQVILDEVPPLIAPLTDKSPVVTKRLVLAQLARDSADEHFPLLIYTGETFGDFTFTTRFKTVAGDREQMAGVAFRIQDEKNYYVVRASSLGNTLRFYKFVNGERSQPIGAEAPIPKGIWHTLSVECKGNRIRCMLNEKELIPPLTDFSFTSGKIGFWTKSDSVSYFAEARITYTPRESLAKVLVRDVLKKYPRLLGLRVYAATNTTAAPHVIASSQETDVGKPGDKVEQDVIARNVIYAGKGQGSFTVTLPLHDRNGDVVAAVRVVLKSFPGQTDQNAVVRAMPVVREMEKRVRSLSDLIQ
jgi:hypothetical protein